MFRKKKKEINQCGETDKQKRFIKLGTMFLVKKEEPYIAKEYYKQAGLKEDDIDYIFDKFEKEKAKSKLSLPSEDKKDAGSIKLKDKERLSLLGVSSIKKNPLFAAVCLEVGGYSSEQIKPLFELAKIKKENKQKPIELNLTKTDKLWLKDLGLASLEKNRTDFAKLCFRGTNMSREEINSLMKLNLLGIEKEREKIKQSIRKIKFQKWYNKI